jgi:glycine cleavage system regulatory protein
MSIHERMEAIADLHAAGGLGADERREADQHAAACAACAALLRDAAEFSAWARGAIAPDAPPVDLEDRLIGRFRASGQSKKRRFVVGKRFLKVTGSIAAAVGLIFLGNLFSDQASFTSLKSLATTEADYRSNDRDWNHANTFWTENGEAPSRKGVPPPRSAIVGFFNQDLGKEAREQALALGRPRGSSRPDTLEAERAQIQRALQEANAPAGLSGVPRDGRFAGKLASKDDPPEVIGGAEANETLSLEELRKTEHGKRQIVMESLSEGQQQVREAAPRKDEAKPQESRKIIRSGEVSLEVDSYDAAYTKLGDLVAAEKGQIAAASTQKMANGKIQASVTLRIPPERFEAVLAKLKDFGTIRNQRIGSEDVTKAYIDLETRLKGKEILAERLRKLLAEGKGTVKELMEVEVQLGATNEAIEQIKGEIKYYDNLVGLSTITLRISEKDLGQPFEYVQSLQSNIALIAANPDDVYQKAQKEITDAGGQVVDSKMSRQSDGSSTGTIRGRVDAEKFPALREALKKLGVVTTDTVNQQKTARGGHEGTPKADAPLRKELAVVDFSVSSPPIFVTRRSQILVETDAVESAYQNSRRAIEAAGGKIQDGSLNGGTSGASATLKAQVDADKFSLLVDSLKTAGKIKNANLQSSLPPLSPEGGAQLLRERAEIELALVSPPQLIGEEHGILRTIRDTFAHSWTGLLWSIEKLFVGISLAGPWIVLLLGGWLLWRRARKKKATQPTA